MDVFRLTVFETCNHMLESALIRTAVVGVWIEHRVELINRSGPSMRVVVLQNWHQSEISGLLWVALKEL